MTSSPAPLCFGLLAFAASAVVACSAPITAIATEATLQDTTTVYALNGTPSSAPNAISLFDGAGVRADVTFSYDLVFDLDSANQVMVIPVRRLTSVGGGFQVGMQVLTQSYDAVTEAPKSNYVNDSTFVVGIGTVLAVQSANPTVCSVYSASPFNYSKIAITAVNTVTRAITVAFTVDRNCSFRSLGPGIPNF